MIHFKASIFVHIADWTKSWLWKHAMAECLRWLPFLLWGTSIVLLMCCNCPPRWISMVEFLFRGGFPHYCLLDGWFSQVRWPLPNTIGVFLKLDTILSQVNGSVFSNGFVRFSRKNLAHLIVYLAISELLCLNSVQFETLRDFILMLMFSLLLILRILVYTVFVLFISTS